MRTRVLLTALVLALVAAAPAHAAVPPAPEGDAFYTPPATLPAGQHGKVVWARATGPRSHLVLYRSVGVNGSPVAVSGIVELPRGRAPRGGWPVISWAHGTTGTADACAPSKDAAAGINLYVRAMFDRWLRAGYAVVRTDYEGLGTPGAHPYLIGTSEGRSTLDIVRAARELSRRVGKRLVIAGHSQGGHAALWAAALAPRYTRELDLRGTVAFAPASNLSELAPAMRTLPFPGLTTLIASIVRGLDTAHPELGLPESLFNARGLELYPHTLDRCLGDLAKPDSYGSTTPKDIFREDADLARTIELLDDNDPENLRIRTPVFVAQGQADTVVQPSTAERLVRRLGERGSKPTFRRYARVDHVGIVAAAERHATRWFRARARP
jgi:pimeloyl-ACP methyl ester carboxylesterase